MNETGAPHAGSALSRLAAEGPLPGIHDEDDKPAAETGAKASKDEPTGHEPIGQRPEDEAEEAVAFRGLR
jgi:hypothetical protein